LILGEKEVLVRVTPISSEMDENLFLNTSSNMGLTFTPSSYFTTEAQRAQRV
jgi:hypothetical protein